MTEATTKKKTKKATIAQMIDFILNQDEEVTINGTTYTWDEV